MKKILGVIVLFAFIFSSCATAPATASVAAPVVNHKNKNTATFAVKGFERFGFLDLKASDPNDDGGKGTEEEKYLGLGYGLIGAALVGGLALAGWGWYTNKLMANPD
jgi:hypothetical protein